MQPVLAPVKTGLDCLSQNFSSLKHTKIAFLAHQASVDKNLAHIIDLAVDAELNVVKIFGPEHGFQGSAQDMEPVEDEGFFNSIPVISLYGNSKETLKVDPLDLADVDLLICDLQDIGSRYYTFANTLAYAMDACGMSKTMCMVLDRPNPINGSDIEGNIVHKGFNSFVGSYPIANRHGMTIGELANLFNKLNQHQCELEVIWMEEYKRTYFFDEIDLPWVAPSPNMPSQIASILYPGGCLIEGTNLSEGRGTTQPFELFGASYIDDPYRLAALIESQNLSGLSIRPAFFKPMFQKYANKNCGGIQIHVTNRKLFEPLKTGVALLWAAKHFGGFTWRTEPYEFENANLAIDLLFGTDEPRKLLEKGASTSDVMSSFQEDKKHFITMRSSFLHPAYGNS